MSLNELFDDEHAGLTFYEYEEAALNHAIYDYELIYPVLGLVSEAGEVADKVKKIIRDDEIDIVDPLVDLTEDQRKAIALELSDCLWYITAAAADVGYDLDEIASMNMAKLSSRQRRGRLKGSGDYR